LPHQLAQRTELTNPINCDGQPIELELGAHRPMEASQQETNLLHDTHSMQAGNSSMGEKSIAGRGNKCQGGKQLTDVDQLS